MKITLEEFEELIKSESIIKDLTIDLSNNNEIYLNNLYKSKLEINNCNFIGNPLIIYDILAYKEDSINELFKVITISNCSFEGLIIQGLSAKIFSLYNLQIKNQGLSIEHSQFGKLSIEAFNNINYRIFINYIETSQNTNILGNKYIDGGSLSISNSSIHNGDFTESRYNDILFQSNTFTGNFHFFKNNLNENSERFLFDECTFEKVNFSRTTFSKNSEFNNCKFYKTSIFHDIVSRINSNINIESCLFEKFVQFNYASLNKLEIDNTKFNEVVSFQEMNLNIISIDRTIFEKTALFDEIQINNIEKCDTRTFRLIKQQLQKAENKIDFNRFRVYEFNAYKKDITEKLIKLKRKENTDKIKSEIRYLKRDKFILCISDLVSEYGTNWIKSLWFTLISGIICYLLLFVIENFSKSVDFRNSSEFFAGIFRFFLVTDFYNPLINDRIYLTNPFSWIVFIFGKILIAFGIYEMIQSFRKFKI
ncbi:MAG TPA: hypothetical protein VK164_11385 [Flavobacterium sp.]|uniref:hypothetical protein n=1 Tax=Flavobacterium sp. TaxID=239 RepID=UPI002B4B83E5|nr:hypothetical protein [Flavobacterium sp.]HLO74531.1 hypothetical protein [Flavobacterium sp.]